MSEAAETTAEDPSNSTSIRLLEDVFFVPIAQALQAPWDHPRLCGP